MRTYIIRLFSRTEQCLLFNLKTVLYEALKVDTELFIKK